MKKSDRRNKKVSKKVDNRWYIVGIFVLVLAVVFFFAVFSGSPGNQNNLLGDKIGQLYSSNILVTSSPQPYGTPKPTFPPSPTPTTCTKCPVGQYCSTAGTGDAPGTICPGSQDPYPGVSKFCSITDKPNPPSNPSPPKCVPIPTPTPTKPPTPTPTITPPETPTPTPTKPPTPTPTEEPTTEPTQGEYIGCSAETQKCIPDNKRCVYKGPVILRTFKECRFNTDKSDCSLKDISVPPIETGDECSPEPSCELYFAKTGTESGCYTCKSVSWIWDESGKCYNGDWNKFCKSTDIDYDHVRIKCTPIDKPAYPDQNPQAGGYFVPSQECRSNTAANCQGSCNFIYTQDAENNCKPIDHIPGPVENQEHRAIASECTLVSDETYPDPNGGNTPLTRPKCTDNPYPTPNPYPTVIG